VVAPTIFEFVSLTPTTPGNRPQALVLSLNVYVVRGKQEAGVIKRGFFDLSEFDMNSLMPALPPPTGNEATIEMEDMKLEVNGGNADDAAKAAQAARLAKIAAADNQVSSP
jgi:hypothetical protein